jgi:hypothetical protein
MLTFVRLDMYLQLYSLHLLQQLLNSFIFLDSLYCGFQARNEALMEPMVAFVQLDLYLQLLCTCYNSCLIL